MMKRILAILLMLCLVVGICALAACDSGRAETTDENEGQSSAEYPTDPEDILDSEVTNEANEPSANEKTTVNEESTANEESSAEETTSEEATSEETASEEAISEETSSETEQTSEEEKTTNEEKTTSEEEKGTEAESGEQNETLVWITESGGRYHKKSTCSGMKNPRQVTVEEAEKEGKTPCGKCYK